MSTAFELEGQKGSKDFIQRDMYRLLQRVLGNGTKAEPVTSLTDSAKNIIDSRFRFEVEGILEGYQAMDRAVVV